MRKTRKYSMSEYELDEENSMDLDSNPARNDHDSDEDTEDASETDMVKQEEEYTEIKEQILDIEGRDKRKVLKQTKEDVYETKIVRQTTEGAFKRKIVRRTSEDTLKGKNSKQTKDNDFIHVEEMYQDKLSNLKKQLKQLKEFTHPEYLRKLKKLQQAHQDRLLRNKCFEVYERERIEKEYIDECTSAVKEFEEKKIELKENLIAELEEKKRMIDIERTNMELTGDSMDIKPVTTRKLRRRPNDPLPLPEIRRRKTLPTQLNYLLDESEALEDLRVINKGKLPTGNKRHESSENLSSNENNASTVEVRVEDGKLYYDKKWYHRGQPIYYDGKEVGSKNSGVICTISPSEIWIKRTSDSSKVRIHIAQLQKGKYTIRRRSS